MNVIFLSALQSGMAKIWAQLFPFPLNRDILRESQKKTVNKKQFKDWTFLFLDI